VVRSLIVPNLKDFEELLQDEHQSNSLKKEEAEKVIIAIINVLGSLVDEDLPMINGHTDNAAANLRTRLNVKVGEVIGSRIADSGHIPLIKAVLEA
jgi:transcription initiation factor TFIID subunit 6